MRLVLVALVCAAVGAALYAGFREWSRVKRAAVERVISSERLARRTEEMERLLDDHREGRLVLPEGASRCRDLGAIPYDVCLNELILQSETPVHCALFDDPLDRFQCARYYISGALDAEAPVDACRLAGVPEPLYEKCLDTIVPSSQNSLRELLALYSPGAPPRNESTDGP